MTKHGKSSRAGNPIPPRPPTLPNEMVTSLLRDIGWLNAEHPDAFKRLVADMRDAGLIPFGKAFLD